MSEGTQPDFCSHEAGGVSCLALGTPDASALGQDRKCLAAGHREFAQFGGCLPGGEEWAGACSLIRAWRSGRASMHDTRNARDQPVRDREG